MDIRSFRLSPLRFDLLQLACTEDGIPGWTYGRMKPATKQALAELMDAGLVQWSGAFIVGTSTGVTVYRNKLNGNRSYGPDQTDW